MNLGGHVLYLGFEILEDLDNFDVFRLPRNQLNFEGTSSSQCGKLALNPVWVD